MKATQLQNPKNHRKSGEPLAHCVPFDRPEDRTQTSCSDKDVVPTAPTGRWKAGFEVKN